MYKKTLTRRSICTIILYPFGQIHATGDNFLVTEAPSTVEGITQNLELIENILDSKTLEVQESQSGVVIEEQSNIETPIETNTGADLGSGILFSGLSLPTVTTTGGDQITTTTLQEDDSIEPEISLEERLKKVREDNEGLCKKSTINCLEKVLDDETIQVTLIEEDKSGEYYDEDTGTLYEYDKPIVDLFTDTSIQYPNDTPIEISSGSTNTGNLLIDSGDQLVPSIPPISGSSIYPSYTTGTGMDLLENIPQNTKKFLVDTSMTLTVGSQQNNRVSQKNLQTSLISNSSSQTLPTVSFEQDTRIESVYGEISSFEHIQFTDDVKSISIPSSSLSSVLLGANNDHLIFSKPVQITLPISGYEDGTDIELSVLHYGQDKFDRSGISVDPNTQCDSEGNTSLPSRYTLIEQGTVTFYTCSASTFVVTYLGGATFDNFIDNGSLSKIITVGAGGILTDLNVLVDFQPIDSEDPASYGTTNAYSNEVSMILQSPTGTSISLLNAGTYNNNGAASRAAVTFDDSAGSGPTNLPIDGTFTPSQALSAFIGEDPIGDWTFTISDNTNQDGVILYEVSLELTDATTCGNNTLAGAEGCDDGNTTNGDGCSDSCLVETGYACNYSGNGAEGVLGCLSGVCDDTEPTPMCEAANSCGNGTIESGESCDDGNTESLDGCSNTCAIEFCGNGLIELESAPSVLYQETFDSINGTSQTATSLSSGTGFSLTYENTGSQGRIRRGTASVQKNSGVGAVTLDANPSGTFVTNSLILEVDLSAAVNANDLTLSFDRADHGDELQAEDVVSIRGSSSDSRITFYNRKANDIGNGIYQSVTGLDIDATLSSNAQVPTSTFQVRFGQNDNFPATSTTASDGLSIDTISISGTLPGPEQDELCDDGNTINGDGCSQICGVESGWICTGEPSSCSLEPSPTGLLLHYTGLFGGGSFTDVSGNTNNGSMLGTVTTPTVNGETVMCIDDNADAISYIGNLVTDYPFSMSTWVKTDSITGTSGILSYARSTATNRMYNIERANATLRARAQNTTSRLANASTTINTTDWFLVTTVFVSSTQRDIYVNGVYEGTNTQTATYDTDTNKRLIVGRFADSSPSSYFRGCVDDVRFYGSEITATQIDALYTSDASLTTSFTTASSPLLTGSIEGINDQIIITVDGNTYTGVNNGDGTRSLGAGLISPSLSSGTYPVQLTVTNPYGKTFIYSSSFVVFVATCGDGDIGGGESCDDGNTSNGDGCSDLCAIESGYSCIGEPSSCSLDNTAPTDITLSGNSIIENNAVGQTIGSLSTTDLDLGDTHTYSFGCAVPLPDESFFSFSGNQLLAGTGFNFEIPFDANSDNDFEVCILTDDGNGGTYEENFTISILDEYEEICIYVGSGVVFDPIPVSNNGNIIASQVLTGWFALEDLNGSNTGYYTTLSIGGFNGALGNFMPATIAEISNTNPVTVVSGSANPNVLVDSALSSFIPFDTPITYLSRNTGTNNGVTGYYSTSPTLRLTIPEYQAVDTYTATITYTLYEN